MSQKTFPELLELILVEEFGYTTLQAAHLVQKHTRVIMYAIMAGGSFRELRPAAMAIKMLEADEVAPDVVVGAAIEPGADYEPRKMFHAS